VAIRDAAVAEKEAAQLVANQWGDECRLLKVQLQRSEDERDLAIQVLAIPNFILPLPCNFV
jgi:hypothetical protein